MELSVDYECPACRKVMPRSLDLLSPGEERTCADCGTATELTAAGLAGLRQRLEELFRH
jgi:hypothetical protein